MCENVSVGMEGTGEVDGEKPLEEEGLQLRSVEKPGQPAGLLLKSCKMTLKQATFGRFSWGGTPFRQRGMSSSVTPPI